MQREYGLFRLDELTPMEYRAMKIINLERKAWEKEVSEAMKKFPGDDLGGWRAILCSRPEIRELL